MSWKATGYVKELRDGLSCNEKFVLLLLAEYHRTDEKSAWPSVSTLAKDSLMTDRGVQQILARLEENGFIVKKSGCGRGNVSGYQIVGVDLEKDEPQTSNDGAVFIERTVHRCDVKGEQTLHSHVVNHAQPASAIRKEPKEPKSRESRRIPPSLEQVKAYCTERRKGVDPDRFFNHYVSNGWKVGKNPMVDWHAAIRTWENSGYNGNGNGNHRAPSADPKESLTASSHRDLIARETARNSHFIFCNGNLCEACASEKKKFPSAITPTQDREREKLARLAAQ